MLNAIATPSCYFFPTTVLLVDDSRAFLDNLQLSLDKNLLTRSFCDPRQALARIQAQNTQAPCKLTANCLKKISDVETDADSNNHTIGVDLSRLYQQVYDPQRFENISVVVVDHDMPEMNGIELCKALTPYPVKKIMLTGVAKSDMAVHAFNNGLIDQFICKSSADLFATLNQMIYELQHNYFKELSQVLVKTIAVNTSFPLTDPAFAEFFYNLRRENKISEYYLLDTSGSFLLLNYHGAVSWLIVRTEAELNDYTDVARQGQAPDQVVAALEARKRIPFFLTEEDYKQPTAVWENYLHPAHKLWGEQVYYYALVDGKNYTLPNAALVMGHYQKLRSASSTVIAG